MINKEKVRIKAITHTRKEDACAVAHRGIDAQKIKENVI